MALCGPSDTRGDYDLYIMHTDKQTRTRKTMQTHHFKTRPVRDDSPEVLKDFIDPFRWIHRPDLLCLVKLGDTDMEWGILGRPLNAQFLNRDKLVQNKRSWVYDSIDMLWSKEFQIAKPLNKTSDLYTFAKAKAHDFAALSTEERLRRPISTYLTSKEEIEGWDFVPSVVEDRYTNPQTSAKA
ncbi:hypothetical protein BKA93DRAFT_562410 [Sparassis latifolia]